MAYCVDSRPAAGVPGEVHTTKLNDLLTVREFNTGTHIYLQGVASVILGSWVSYDELGVTTGVDSDVAGSIKGPVAIATAAVDATTEYGWFGIDGHFICGAISGGDAAADGKVFATATVFLADDVAVTGNQIYGAVFRTQEGEANTPLGLSATAALATVEIHSPWIGATDAII